MSATTCRGALRSLALMRKVYGSMGRHPSLTRSMSTKMPTATPIMARVGRRRFTSLIPGGTGGGGGGGGIGVETVPVDESVTHNNGIRFLNEAVAEGRRVLEFCHGEKGNARKNSNNKTKKESPITKEELQELETVVDRFLEATMATAPLSQAMAMVSRDTNDNVDDNKERVKILHGAFLSLALKCITTLMQEGVDGKTTTGGVDTRWSSPPPLLEKVLQLVTRARKDLNLPCPLPLYQWLAVMVAQTSDSSSTITQWILQAGQWARDDFGMESIYQEPQEFFAKPLYHLAQRKRYEEMVEILLVVLETESFAQRYLKEESLKPILTVMQDDLKTHLWTLSSSSKAAPNSEAGNALLQVVLLLEPSIWFVFGYSSSSLVSSPRSLQFMGIESLKSAITEILAGVEKDDNDSINLRTTAELFAESGALLQALFPNAFREDLDGEDDDFDDDDNNDDEDDDDNDDDTIIYQQQQTKESWEIILDVDSDMAIVGINRIMHVDEEGDAASDDDDDDDDDDDVVSQTTQWDTRELYSRSSLPAPLPDVVQQLEQVIGRPLKYSKRLEQDLIRTMDSYDV